jgi:hypothetical protein
MTDEERNRAQDILDNLLRDEYMRGFQDCLVTSFSKSESESIINELKKQNAMMLDTLKSITKYAKEVDMDCSLLMGSRIISIEERDQKSMWAVPIIKSCEMIAYVEGENQ